MRLHTRCWLAVAAGLGAVGVALGAFGAHGLPDWLAQLGYQGDDLSRRVDIFETAVRYQVFHALALALTALGGQVASPTTDARRSRAWSAAAWLFLLGMIVFSGLLYVLTLAGPQLRWLGMIVPLGGLAMIAGWVLLGVAAWRS